MPKAKRLKNTGDKEKNINEEEDMVENDDDDSKSIGSSDEDDESDDEDVDINEEIMVDFEAREIAESDLESVRTLISAKLAPFGSLNVNDIATIVVQQEEIGNVIFQDLGDNVDDEDDDENATKEEGEKKKDGCEMSSSGTDEQPVLGLVSLIDLKSSQCKTFSNMFTQFLVRECEKFERQKNNNTAAGVSIKGDKLRELFKAKSVAYVVNERFINIPAAISVPMFESLLSDLEKKANEKTSSFDYWLFVSKLYLETTTKKIHYANQEEEIFEELSDFKFDISYGNRATKSVSGNWSQNDVDLEPFVRVLLLPSNKVKESLEKIKLLVN